MEYILHNFFSMLIIHSLKVCCDSYTTVISIDLDSDLNFPMDAGMDLNTTTKSALRYGFHKTEECPQYKISYLCIQKCLDLNFDVAYADKNCKCTCYIKREKAKYSPKSNTTRTKWKLGAPTTKIPAWVDKKKKGKGEKEKDKNKGKEEGEDGRSGEISILVPKNQTDAAKGNRSVTASGASKITVNGTSKLSPNATNITISGTNVTSAAKGVTSGTKNVTTTKSTKV